MTSVTLRGQNPPLQRIEDPCFNAQIQCACPRLTVAMRVGQRTANFGGDRNSKAFCLAHEDAS